ncbi:MAG: PHP domain-containing protein [Planctomycetaceae bacterium]|nr:PHP domain-containing protein [Planctomycetaceae bacterium]
MMQRFARWSVLIVVFGCGTGRLCADALERMALDKLQATHQAVELLKGDWEKKSLPSEFRDYRGVMHVHSLLSHDSRSQPEEIRKACKAIGVEVVMFNEHPAAHYDFVKDGHRGLTDGVLFVPGAEFGGLLAYPQKSVTQKEFKSPQERVDVVNDAEGMTFLCHLEERMDWDLVGMTGSEIYNTHADFKDEARLVKSIRSPIGMVPLLLGSRSYPQETMAALQDYPADYLRRWDELCQKYRLTGVAANDAHHNQGLNGTIQEDGKLKLEGRLGEQVGTVDPKDLPLLAPLLFGKKKGETIVLMDLDPYERSFSHVSTHMFLSEQTEPAVREALKSGRTYVSFEWISDPRGFNFQATQGEKVFEMGSEIPFGEGIQFRSVANLPVRFRLMKDGKEADAKLGREYGYEVKEAGIYRIEAWVNLPDGPQIWILSSPIYIRAA